MNLILVGKKAINPALIAYAEWSDSDGGKVTVNFIAPKGQGVGLQHLDLKGEEAHQFWDQFTSQKPQPA